jgi:hypothetical protein
MEVRKPARSGRPESFRGQNNRRDGSGNGTCNGRDKINLLHIGSFDVRQARPAGLTGANRRLAASLGSKRHPVGRNGTLAPT